MNAHDTANKLGSASSEMMDSVCVEVRASWSAIHGLGIIMSHLGPSLASDPARAPPRPRLAHYDIQRSRQSEKG